jgi:hypothetical protein
LATYLLPPSSYNVKGLLTVYLREKTIGDAVQAAVIRKQHKLAKKNEKARLHAKKLMDLDVAVQTKLANTNSELNGEIAAFGNSKGALKTFLQEQYKSRMLLRDGVYKTIPVGSEYRSKTKPYRLRMNPLPTESRTNSNDVQITYLKSLLNVMMAEDAQRPLEATAQPQDAKLVRNLPVISQQFLNPRSTHLKQLQQDTVAALAQPKDNPWYTRLLQEYLGKILWDGGLFRVFAIQYNANKGRNVYPCWEATAEPVYKDEDDTFVVHPRHQATMEDGSKILLKSAEVGFGLAEYSEGDDAEPVKLTFVDECHAKYLQREARLQRKPAANRLRRQPAPGPENPLASQPPALRKRRTPAPAKHPPPTPLRSSRRRPS